VAEERATDIAAAPPHDDPLHDALAGLFAHVHALLDHLPGHGLHHGLHVPGLLSPAQIRAKVDEEIARARRYGGTLSLLLIDVDETGTPELEAAAHAGGNVVRREVQRVIAEALVGSLRTMDSTGRYGEDGFLVLLPETGAEESLSAGARFGRLIGQAVEEHVASLDGRGGEVPAFELRCGVTTYPVAAQAAPDLLAQVQEALRWTRTAPEDGWLRHALPHLNVARTGRGFRCVCRRCGKVFEVDDRAHQRARRFCSHGCYVADRRESERGRDEAIRAARGAGASLRELARRYSLSAERVRQICQAPV
jgi:diguanylate cyclase (GGDEF)-like protein